MVACVCVFFPLIVKKNTLKHPDLVHMTLFSDHYKNPQQVHCHFRQKFKCTKQDCVFHWYKIYKVLVLMLQSRLSYIFFHFHTTNG